MDGVFQGRLETNGNLRRTGVSVAMQRFQQWTGVNFIFYYGTIFQKAGVPQTTFIIGIITTVVNFGSTPLSFWTIERFGRRPLLIYGALGMLTCEFIIAIVGTVAPSSAAAGYVLVVFICIYISFFASTWGLAAWVIIGEIYPLPIRAKGVALSTVSNCAVEFL